MTFGAPWSALLAAAIAIPLLLLLYFLKLRRRLLRFPSTLLWQRTFEDLQVNVPFQRLRFSLLLLLQLLVLIALLLALAQPRLQAETDPAARLVMLIDRSASMSAVDVDGRSRLDAARDAARQIVEQLGRGRRASQVMVVSFAASARLVSGFESDRQILLDRIDSIQPSDAEADLGEALRLADAFSSQSDEDAPPSPDVVLFSDGGVEDPGETTGFALQTGNFRFAQIAPTDPIRNVGIVSFSARRDFEDPARVLLFARLLNAGDAAVAPVLTLRRDDEVVGIKRMTVPPADARRPGEASVTFALELSVGAVFSLRHNFADSLAADDVAWLVMPPPGRPRIALVHAGDGPDPFLQDVINSMDPLRLDLLTPGRFQSIDQQRLDSGVRFDLVVFDRVAPDRLPGVPSVTFGAVPVGIETTGEAPETGRRLLTWDRQHPLLRHVELDNVVYAGFSGFKLPPGAKALAYGPTGPVMALIPVRGARHVLVGFELSRSNWPVQVSFTVFMLNALDYLTLTGSNQAALVNRPGEPLTVRVRPDAESLQITGPQTVTVPVEAGRLRTLPALERVGAYTVQGASPPMNRIAISMLSDAESDIRPVDSIIVNARAIAAGRAREIAPRELWPWLVALAGLLLVLEWLTYCWRMSG